MGALIAVTLGAGLWPCAGLAGQPNQVPPFQVVDGETTTTDGWLVAKTATTIEIPMASEASLILEGRTGKNKIGAGIEGGSIVVSFLGEDGQKAVDDDGKVSVPFILYAADKKIGDATFGDAYIFMNWPLEFYVRPNISLYNAEHQKKLLESWSSLPAASDHAFRLEFRHVGKVFQIWFDGNFMAEMDAPANSVAARVGLAPGASLRKGTSRLVETSPWEALPVGAVPRPGEMTDLHLKFDHPSTLPAVFQKLSGTAAGISLSELDQFTKVIGKNGLIGLVWSRNTKDQLPEQRMFTVPLDTYSEAYLLCAVEDDPAKSNSFTLRMTRYGKGRGNAMADTIVTVPRGEAAPSGDDKVQRVGTVNFGPEDARKSAPLWLIKVPIKNGLIQDLLEHYALKTDYQGNLYEDALKKTLYKHLDVELINGPLLNVDAADAFPPPMEKVQRSYWPTPHDYTGYDFYTSIPPPVDSGVHVFAAALEKSPVQMTVKSNIGIRVFYASDHPQFDVDLKARKAGEYAVAWEYADVDGKIVDHGEKESLWRPGARRLSRFPSHRAMAGLPPAFV